VKKVTFVVFRGGDRPNLHPWIHPWPGVMSRHVRDYPAWTI